MSQTFPEQVEYRTVDSVTIRRAFNEGRFWERAQADELSQQLREESIHLKGRHARRRGEPPCTRSKMVEYFEESGRKVALVHLYRRRDGSIGGQGLPDPKWLRVGSQIWTIE